MAVQIDYLAPKGWQPPNADEDYIIVYFKIELADGVPADKFIDGAASVAAESSTGTWTVVDEGPNSGFDNANIYKALVFDLDEKNKRFKVAYKVQLFEYGNLAGFLAGPLGNVNGMKMVKGMRILDIRFPRKFIKSFKGPKFGIEGLRELLGHYDDSEDPLRAKMPLLGTVPKPKVGRTAAQQAELARLLWSAGDNTYDFIKDDENLTSLPFNNFYDRAKLILQNQREVEALSNNKRFALLNVTHSDLREVTRRAEMIQYEGGRYMMIDVIAMGWAGVQYIRDQDFGLAIHAHRAMHGFIDRESGDGIDGIGELKGFSISFLVIAKMMRMLGVDSLHTGSPKAKMEDYGESEIVAKTILNNVVEPDESHSTLGQKWFGMNPTWPVASGGLHPGVLDTVVQKLGSNILIQLGGGVLGHPGGIVRGVQAATEARKAIAMGMTIKEFTDRNPNSALAEAVSLWGFEPRIVY